MPDSPADPVAAYLEQVRERSERPLPDVTSLPIAHDGVRTLMESAADVPRLLAAVEVALSYHRQVGKGCLICGRVWPCAEGAALTRALLGEGE